MHNIETRPKETGEVLHPNFPSRRRCHRRRPHHHRDHHDNEDNFLQKLKWLRLMAAAEASSAELRREEERRRRPEVVSKNAPWH